MNIITLAHIQTNTDAATASAITDAVYALPQPGNSNSSVAYPASVTESENDMTAPAVISVEGTREDLAGLLDYEVSIPGRPLTSAALAAQYSRVQ